MRERRNAVRGIEVAIFCIARRHFEFYHRACAAREFYIFFYPRRNFSEEMNLYAILGTGMWLSRERCMRIQRGRAMLDRSRIKGECT